MPSAIRLAGFVVFAAMGWVVSEMIIPLMPEGTNPGGFSIYNAILGAILGWVMMKPSVARSPSGPMGAGITTAVAIVFWGLFFHALAEMIKQSMRMRYDGPVEAVVNIFQIMMDYGVMIAAPAVIITTLVFGALGGIFCGAVAKRWP
jgi:small-conductance mechanosensitive channel